MRLTKSEKETIILFNESEAEASIYTYNTGLKTRLKKFSRQYPQLCHLKEKNKYGGVEYLIDKSRLSVHFQLPYSEERIETVSIICDELFYTFQIVELCKFDMRKQWFKRSLISFFTSDRKGSH